MTSLREQSNDSEKGDTASGSNQAPSGVNRETDPTHSESPLQQQPAVRAELSDSEVTAQDSTQDSDESEPDIPPEAMPGSDADVLFGVDPDTYIRSMMEI